MTKPIVRFLGEPIFDEYPQGTVAGVHAVDHPILGWQYVRTSLIVQKNDDGSFETLNTIYTPYKEQE